MQHTHRSQYAFRWRLRGGKMTGSTPLSLSSPSNTRVHVVALPAQCITLCSASNLAEARRLSSSLRGRIACKDASLFEAFSCPWTSSSIFYKLLYIERPNFNPRASRDRRRECARPPDLAPSPLQSSAFPAQTPWSVL